MAGEDYTVSYNGNPYMQPYVAQNASIPARQLLASNYGYADPSFGRYPDRDTFQKSGPGLGTATVLTALGGGAGAATGYWFMNNPVSKAEDGTWTVKENFAEVLDKQNLAEYLKQRVTNAKNEILRPFGVDAKQYEAIEQLSKAAKLEDLAEDVRKNLPKEFTTPQEARNFVTRVSPELEKLNIAEITKNAQEEFTRVLSFKGIQDAVKNYAQLEEGLTQLGKSATPEQIKEFLNQNKGLFRAKNEEELAKYIQQLETMNQEELLKEIQGKKLNLQKMVNLQHEKILKYVDKESGKLLQDAPKQLQALFKDFQWSQLKRLGGWGAAIGAGVGMLAMLFGGGNDNA